jgi:hypothetical protein
MATYGAYTANGCIIRASDGANIPPDPGNRDYQDAMAALAAGDTITAYAPPAASTNPADYPLTMRQLRLALLTLGAKPVDFVASVIANIPDATEKGKATIWYEETVDDIRWDHPETQYLIAASGLSAGQASTLWIKAAAL